MENKQNLYLNKDTPVKQYIDSNDYVLLTGQDKNIQKDYIANMKTLKEIFLTEMQNGIYENIIFDKNLKVTKSGKTLYLSYNDLEIKQLIKQNAEQIQALIQLFNGIDGGGNNGITEAQVLDLVQQRVSTAENLLNQRIDGLTAALNAILGRTIFLEDNVTEVVQQQIELPKNYQMDL